jgi:hypothetical protein
MYNVMEIATCVMAACSLASVTISVMALRKSQRTENKITQIISKQQNMSGIDISDNKFAKCGEGIHIENKKNL